MRVAILGGPGSGKGTQARMLSDKYRVPQISTGEILREAVKNDKALGKQVKKTMADGNLVDDEVVLKLLEERLRRKDTKRGFIIDGFPRNIPQAQSLDTLLGMLGRTLQIAINIHVDDDVLVKRVVGRIGCDKCGAIYNRYFSPPQTKSSCDECGGSLSSRADDNTKTATNRIAVYHEETSPLITYYKAQHKLRTMPGMGDMMEIHEKLCDLVDLEIRPLEIKTVDSAADSNGEAEATVIAGGQINRVPVESKPKTAAPRASASSRSASKKKTATTSTTKKKAVTTKSAAGSKKATKKKAAAKKTTAKKSVSKKTTKKTSAKKTTAKKATGKKVTKATQPASKKKVASKKASAAKKKVVKKKNVAKKKAPVKKKTGTKKAATKKAAAKKAPAKKAAAKKKAGRK